MLRIKQNNRKVCLCSIREREKGSCSTAAGRFNKRRRKREWPGQIGKLQLDCAFSSFYFIYFKRCIYSFSCGRWLRRERGCFSLYSSSNWRDTRRGIYQPENKRWKKKHPPKIKETEKNGLKKPRNVDFCAWNNPSLYVNGPMMMCC